MKTPVKVSVIVPVYNTGKYLGKCLDSLIAQTLESIEIIIVNDGSRDGSREIIESFKCKYPGKITTLEQENRGPGAARNLGIAHASGEYIGFADSDDWVEPEMFEAMYKEAVQDGADAVICDISLMREEEGGYAFIEIMRGCTKQFETVSDYIRSCVSVPAAWNKLLRRELVRRVPFLELQFAEDLATIPVMLSFCSKITYLPKPLYYYLKRRDAITMQEDNPVRIDTTKAWERCLNDCNPQYKEELEHSVYFSVVGAIAEKPDYIEYVLEYFRKNKENFKRNKYIREAISKNRLLDLVGITGRDAAALTADDTYEKNLASFLEETRPLIEQLGSLPQEVAAELYDMYKTTLQTAVKNMTHTELRFIPQLYDRREHIRERLERRHG